MRTTQIGIAGVIASLLAFTGIAHASATIDLLWEDGTTDTLCGAPASSNITLNVVLTAGPNGSVGAGISVDYSDAAGKADLIDFGSSAGNSVFPIYLGTTFDSDSGWVPPSPRYWWQPGDSVSVVHNINGASIPAAGWGLGLSAGQSHLLGTLTFHKTKSAGGFEIIPLSFRDADGEGTDGVLDGDGNTVTDTTTFNSAYLVKSGIGKGGFLNDRAGKRRRCR